MKIKSNLLNLLAAVFIGTSLSAPAMAENTSDFGAGYRVHYNAFTTDILNPEVAKHYSITRSKNRGMLNIVVLKKVMETTGQPVTAEVTASATNLNGQLKELTLREVKEENAIYYIGDFRVTDGETLIFTINVTPTGTTESHQVKFRQQFFTD